MYAAWPPRRQWLAALLLLLPLAYFVLFYRLGSHPVVILDEARLACNAAEMLHNGNWLVTHFDGKPDLWNTKPPLLIWLQAGLFFILGPTEFALRLPSALAALGTALLLFGFGQRVLRAPLLGLGAAVVLLSCSGYVDQHITRTGDYDALLVFFITWYTLAFFRYLEDGHRPALWQASAGLALAVLTKGVAGVIPLPGLLLYALLSGRTLWLIRQPKAYVALAAAVAVVAAYYLAREAAGPGYWAAVAENELGGRLLKDKTFAGDLPWTWYLDMLLTDELLPWLYLAPLGVVALLLRSAPPTFRRLLLLIVTFIVPFMVVISLSVTKYFWYEAPIYPFFALLVGAGLALVAEALVLRLSPERQRPWPVLVLLACLLYAPLATIGREAGQFYSSRFDDPDLLFGRYLRHQHEYTQQIDKYALLSGVDYNATMEFYKSAAILQYGDQVTTYYPWGIKSFHPQDVVVACNPAIRARLDSTYNTITLYEEAPCATLLIQGLK